jgi:hypothetical protein
MPRVFVSSVVDAPAEVAPYRFRHSFVIASIPAFVFLGFLAKVLFQTNLNHLKHLSF